MPFPAARATRSLALVAVLALALGLTVRGRAEGRDPKPRSSSELVGPVALELTTEPGRLGLTDQTIARLVGDSLRAIASYYGALPFERVRVVVTPEAGRRINGTTRCSRGTGRVALTVGRGASEADFRDDWIVTHELLHVAFTSLEDDDSIHQWVGEGLSSYVEPLVRVRAGTLTEAKLWRDLLEGAPQGLPEAGDQGLNRTHTWGRTYWGGDLFWLEVDLAVRQATGNAKSLRDVLRAVAAAGTNVCVDWSMARVLATGDAATGTRALTEVYARRALTSAAPDIRAWWAWLGVSLGPDGVVFDERAPGAETRRRMTRD
jgi:predicted metalloprotease with PDZ domain